MEQNQKFDHAIAIFNCNFGFWACTHSISKVSLTYNIINSFLIWNPRSIIIMAKAMNCGFHKIRYPYWVVEKNSRINREIIVLNLFNILKAFLNYRVSHSEMIIYRQWKKIQNEQFFIITLLYSRKLNDFLIFGTFAFESINLVFWISAHNIKFQ